MQPKEQTYNTRTIVSRYGKKSENGNLIKNMFPGQAYLYDEILQLENN